MRFIETGSRINLFAFPPWKGNSLTGNFKHYFLFLQRKFIFLGGGYILHLQNSTSNSSITVLNIASWSLNAMHVCVASWSYVSTMDMALFQPLASKFCV